jgi:hypothetical protein
MNDINKNIFWMKYSIYVIQNMFLLMGKFSNLFSLKNFIVTYLVTSYRCGLTIP